MWTNICLSVWMLLWFRLSNSYKNEYNKAQVCLHILWLQLFKNRTLCQIHDLSHSRSTLESSEGRIYDFRRKNKSSEGSQMHQKVELSKRLCPERWQLESCKYWSTSPSKLLLYDSRINSKGQMWFDNIQKKRWQV